MIILDTTQAIEIVLGGAVTANELDWTAHYADYVGATPSFTPGATSGTTNGAAPVDMVASPGSGLRMVKALTIYNADTVDATATVRFDDNGTDRAILVIALATGESVQYADGKFEVRNASGSVKTVLNYVHTHTSDAGGGTIDHGALTGRGDDDHSIYVLADGTRAGASSQAQDFGANGVAADVIAESTADTGVTVDGLLLKDGNVDGIDASAHATRHDAGGADALSTVPDHDHSGDAGDGGTIDYAHLGNDAHNILLNQVFN